MHPTTAHLLHHHRRTVAELDQLLELLRAGTIATREGTRDTTADSIARLEEQRARLLELIEKYDPEGFTKLVSQPGAG